MPTIHYLAGLPRSGSTLLGNILAQHPDVSVTGTSPLFGAVNAISDALSGITEVAAELANVPGTYDRYVDAVRSFMQTWHSHHDTPIVIDKHRGWPRRFALLEQIDPDSQIIACVRDPRSVVASFERQDRKTSLFNNPVAPTLYQYAETVMSPDGMVGTPLRAIEDLLRRQVPVIWVRFETLIASPAVVLGNICTSLGLDDFEFDLDNIVNVATDLDEIYLNKYPHEGSGALTPDRARGWDDVMGPELAGHVAAVAPLFMQTFAYV